MNIAIHNHFYMNIIVEGQLLILFICLRLYELCYSFKVLLKVCIICDF